MIGEHHGYALGRYLDIYLAAARMDDHIYFALVHGYRDVSYHVGVKAETLEHALCLAGRLARTGKILPVNVKMELHVIH